MWYLRFKSPVHISRLLILSCAALTQSTSYNLFNTFLLCKSHKCLKIQTVSYFQVSQLKTFISNFKNSLKRTRGAKHISSNYARIILRHLLILLECKKTIKFCITIPFHIANITQIRIKWHCLPHSWPQINGTNTYFVCTSSDIILEQSL